MIYIKIIIIFLLNFILSAAYAEDKIVNVYALSGYLSEDIIQLFEKQTGIHVNHSIFLNNEVLYTKLKADSDSGYDVIMPSNYFIPRMIEQKLIQKLNKSKLTNFKNLNPLFLNQEYDKNNQYSLPYLYVATGVAINKKYRSSP